MNRIDKLRSYFKNIEPVHHLINLAYRGADIGVRPNQSLLQKVITEIKKRKPVILFNSFWTHKDVDKFVKNFMNKLTPDDVEWYLEKLCSFIKNRDDLHLIEKVNLFHTFGLTRLLGDDDTLKLIEDRFGYKDEERFNKIKTLTDMSAQNAIAMIKYKDLKDTFKTLKRMKDNPSIIPIYSKYQVFYYDGQDNFYFQIKKYLDSDKIVLVPQSALALLWISKSENNKELYSKVKDEIFPSFPKNIINIIEKTEKYS